MTEHITCIVCPKGCDITIEHDGNNIISVNGYTCKRGLEYAGSEICDPRRTITSTVLTDSGTVVSVKTNKPIPKALVFDCMKQISAARATMPVKIGDVIIHNVLDTGANVVATQNKS